MRISDWSSDVCSSDLRLDVADGLKAAGLARTLADEAIDVLINNAGVYGPRSGFGATDYDAWAEVLQVNTLAPLRMVERFAGLIEKTAHKTVINISSRMGSIGENTPRGPNTYRPPTPSRTMFHKYLQ